MEDLATHLADREPGDWHTRRSGLSEEDYLRQLGEPLTPEAAGAAIVDLVRADAASIAPAYLLSGEGLKALT